MKNAAAGSAVLPLAPPRQQRKIQSEHRCLRAAEGRGVARKLHPVALALTDRKINPALLSPLADRSAPGPSGELAGIALDDILLLRSHDGQCPLSQWAAFRPDARPRQRAIERASEGYQPRESSSLMLTLFKTEAQVSQSASSTLLYLASNGFLVAVVRSMS